MQYSELCNELNNFLREETPLSAIKDCFSLYWNEVQEKGDTDENIAKVEILQIAVEAYENGHFSIEDLRETIVHYSSGAKQFIKELMELRQRVTELETPQNEFNRIEEELKSSEEQLKLLFDFATDAYYFSDLKGNFIDGNRASEKLSGYKREEFINKSFLKLNLLPPDQIPKATAILVKNAMGESTGPDEFIVSRKDNTQVLVELRTYPAKIKGQSLLLGIARDITERKKLDQVRSQFIDKATHELRMPLISIKGYINYINSGKLGSLPGVIKTSVEVVKRNIDQLLYLTDLLDIQQIESGELHLELVDLNLSEIIDICMKDIKDFINEKKQKLHLEIPNGLLMIRGDPIRLRQAIMNILHNATMFTPEDGTITLSVEVEDNVIHIQVSDTGIGIRKEDLKRIFQPFDDIKKPTYFRGANLGLSVTKGLIEAHGGKIWVHSEGEGKGATFIFTLPRLREK